jgi:hypothetical protein
MRGVQSPAPTPFRLYEEGPGCQDWKGAGASALVTGLILRRPDVIDLGVSPRTGATWLGSGRNEAFRAATGLLNGVRVSRLYLPPRREDSVEWEAAAAHVIEGRQATRRNVGPAARNGSWRVSMYQIALASSRASSTRATLLPRCLPSRRFVRE